METCRVKIHCNRINGDVWINSVTRGEESAANEMDLSLKDRRWRQYSKVQGVHCSKRQSCGGRSWLLWDVFTRSKMGECAYFLSLDYSLVSYSGAEAVVHHSMSYPGGSSWIHVSILMELSVFPRAMFTVCAGLCMDSRRQAGTSIATLTTNSLRLVSNNCRRRVVYMYERIKVR